MKRNFVRGVLLAAAMGISGAGQAALHDRGGGLIYDDVLDITWLQDANYAMTSGYDADGKMWWSQANDWAVNLNYAGYNDWRLPTTNCLGYCGTTDSEMGFMFYINMEATAGKSILTGANTANLALFTNLQSVDYWTKILHGHYPNSISLYAAYIGYEQGYNDSYDLFAWAVRDGDVAAVPEPETYALMLVGLGLVGFAARRRRG